MSSVIRESNGTLSLFISLFNRWDVLNEWWNFGDRRFNQGVIMFGNRIYQWSINAFFPMFPPRANACVAGVRCYRCPTPAVVAAVGEFGVQPDTLPHLLSVPLLPIHHGRRRRRPQHHCARVPGSRTQHLTLHAAWSATLPRHPCPSVTCQPRGEERGKRGHVPDRWGQ